MSFRYYKIHIITVITALVIASLYSISFLFYLYELLQTSSFSEFIRTERVKFIHALAWFICILTLVYTLIFFNYSWKNSIIRKFFKGWNKPFANSITNVSLFILFAFIAHILYLFLPDNGEIYSISFFLNKFLFA